MSRWVEIAFDCLPLRSVARLDPPLDADAKLIEKSKRIKSAVQTHGTHNTYYLHNAECVFHFTNDETKGMVAFAFEGVVATCSQDLTALSATLDVTLQCEDCSWLNQTIVQWLQETVQHAVLVEFNRFIAAGDLRRTSERLEALEKELESRQGFVGMYL